MERRKQPKAWLAARTRVGRAGARTAQASDGGLRSLARYARALLLAGVLLSVVLGHVAADAPSPLPGLVNSPVLLKGLRALAAGPTGGDALSSSARSALTIPLNLQFGAQSGVSFLFNRPAALAAGGAPVDGKTPVTTTYGFSNTLALGGSGVRLSGLMYFSGDKAGKGQAVSQALSFGRAGWQFDAHYQSVGKNFRGTEALRGAAPALAMQSAATAAGAGQLDGARGRTDVGFGTHFAGKNQKIGFSYQQSDDDLKKTRTLQQSLSYARSFAGGLQFEGGRDTLTADPAGGAARQGTTAATDRLRLGWQNRQGLTFDSRWTQESQSGWKRAGQDTQLSLTGPLRRGLSVDAHQTTHSDGATGRRDLHRDLSATLDTPHLARLHGARWEFNLAQAVLQGQARTETRFLSFDTDLTPFHLRLEHAGYLQAAPGRSSSIVSQGVRVTSLSSQGRLQIDANYVQRRPSLGGHVPDVRDYKVRLQFPRVALAYHTLDQRENPDGSITDIVETNVQAGGALSKKLAWNVQYDDVGSRASSVSATSLLVGVQGTLAAPDSVQIALGLTEKQDGAAVEHGETVRMVYNCKMDDADSVAVTSDMALWDRRSALTPDPLDAHVRVDLARLF